MTAPDHTPQSDAAKFAVHRLHRAAIEAAQKERLRRMYAPTPQQWIVGVPALLILLVLAFGR